MEVVIVFGSWGSYLYFGNRERRSASGGMKCNDGVCIGSGGGVASLVKR